MARTNKTERTAIHLTRIAMMLDVRTNSAMSTELYEMAHDNGISMFDGRDCKTLSFNHVLFIPGNVADATYGKWAENRNDTWGYLKSDTFSRMLETWYNKAALYYPKY